MLPKFYAAELLNIFFHYLVFQWLLFFLLSADISYLTN